jgi:O-antigen ligase
VRGLRTSAAEQWLIAGAAAMSATAAFALVEVSPAVGMALALLPLVAVAGVYIVTSGQVVLYAAAIALPMAAVGVVSKPVLGSVYLQDVIVVFALGAWVFATLLGRGRVPSIPHTPVLGWPFVIFAAAILSATLRGHYAYGASLLGQPLRLFLYAAIVAGLAGVTAQTMYRLLLALFYPGAVLAAFLALYYLATGASATDQAVLSTGGTRLLGISTSLYCAGALFLALLNLRLAPSAGARVLHLGVASVATFGVVVGFGRAAYTAVGLVCLLFVLTSRRLRSAVLSVVPLALPFVILFAIAVSQAAPDLVDSVASRVSSPPATDPNVQWRLEANRAVVAQVREQPLFGVGFGRTSEFFLNVEDPTTGIPTPQQVEVDQDPHNGYLLLWAGGGLFALGSFALLLGTYGIDALRRYRSNPDPIGRLIILWGSATLFVFLFNAGSGTSFANPTNILTIWALLVLPAVVPRATQADSVTAGDAQRFGRPSVVPAGSAQTSLVPGSSRPNA